MTRPVSDVERALKLRVLGMSKKAIAEDLQIARATVRAWLDDPEWALSRGKSIREGGRGGGMECTGECAWRESVPEDSYAYLLGMYLGDGCISRHARSFRLRIFCDEKYVRIIRDVEAAIQAMGRRPGRVQCEGCLDVGAHSQHWPCLFPQHGTGRKHERPIVLVPWQQEIVQRHPKELLRGLLHSDGCRVMNVAVRRVEGRVERRYYTRYHFTNVSEDIKGIFCAACDLLGIRWKRSGTKNIDINRRPDVAFLDTFVGPKS